MQYDTYPTCCGIAIITKIGGSGEWWDSDGLLSKNLFVKTFKEASSIHLQYAMVLVALNTKQLEFYEPTLKRLKFERLNERINPKSGKKIYLYCWTRPAKKNEIEVVEDDEDEDE